MRRLSADLPGLQWSRPSWLRGDYELRAGDELVATIKVRGLARRRATVESSDGTWTLTRCGVSRNGGAIAGFAKSIWRSTGELTFASGATYTVGTNGWMTRADVRNAAGELLIEFHRRGVQILPAARAIPELFVLVAFAWFHVVMLEEDASAAIIFSG